MNTTVIKSYNQEMDQDKQTGYLGYGTAYGLQLQAVSTTGKAH